MGNETFKINDSKIISETLEGETILINLETGHYYSLNKTATIVWEKIQSKASMVSIAGFFKGHEKDISEFIESLVTGGLIIKANDSIASVNGSSTAGAIFDGDYIVPVMTKYDDMKEMLLADPIHDVDNAGWPKLK